MKQVFYIAVSLVLASCAITSGVKKVGKSYTTKSGLKYTITKRGDGGRPSKGEKLKVHFVGKLKNGEQFASTHERGLPVVFQLGSGQVISGLDEFFGMVNQGTEATLEVPFRFGLWC